MNKTESFHFKIEKTMLKSLENMATDQSRTVASLIRQAIAYFIRQSEKQI